MSRSLQQNCQRTTSQSPKPAIARTGNYSQVRIAKVRNAIPARMPVLLSRLRRLDDAVLGALDGVVGPARQQVRGVDDNGVFDGRRVDEVAVWREDLKAAGHVLEEEGYGAWFVRMVRDGEGEVEGGSTVVGVSASADTTLVLFKFACWAGWVVKESGVIS